MAEFERKSKQKFTSDEVPVGPNRLLDVWPGIGQMSAEKQKPFREVHQKIRHQLGDTAFVQAVRDQGLNGE
jgi:hypothetical protein